MLILKYSNESITSFQSIYFAPLVLLINSFSKTQGVAWAILYLSVGACF